MGNSLATSKDIAIILGTVVALVTFFFGALEYLRQAKQSRMQAFVDIRRRFLETPRFREILDLLATDDPRLAEVSLQEKRNFIGFLEEIALLVDSRLINRDVVGYMFGHYVLLCRRSEHLWEGLDADSLYWRVFHRFADDMERFAEEGKERTRSLRV